MVDGTCAECGYGNPLGSNYCSSCGAQIGRRRSDETNSLDATVTVVVAMDDAVTPTGTAMLVVRQGAKRGSRIALDSDRIQMGRHPESDVFLDDITVSRRHAEIVSTPDGHDVADVGSLNGTYVNLDRVERTHLVDGDELRVGKFKLVYVALGEGT